MKIRGTATYPSMGVTAVRAVRAVWPLGVLGGLLGSVPAFAQPVTPPLGASESAPCEVRLTLTRVPPEVRNVVDSWVHNGSACTTPLDVSIEAVDDGYVVNARDARGGLRVRLVPDAQTIGVLIASWSADDRVAPAGPDVEAEGPSMVPVMPVGIDGTRVVSRAASRSRRVLFSGLAGGATGFRGEVDLLGGVIPIGLALGGQTDDYQFNVHATLYSGVDLVIQRCHLRAAVGAGTRVSPEIHSDAGLWRGDLAFDFVVEASVTASVELGAGWGLTAGALATQTYVIYRNSPHETLPITPMALIGMSRQL